jgi:hypothetical protein
MRDALNTTGRPVVYSVDEWGIQDVARWYGYTGNSWTIAYASPLSSAPKPSSNLAKL